MVEDGGEEKAPVRAPAIFISYASQDAAIADTVVATLERAGLRCWVAPRDVVPGALYADEIVQAINDAQVVVLILSEAGVASPHVGKEIERASSKRRRIVALRTDDVPLTRAFEYFLSESQWIDVGPGDIEASVPKLVEAIRRHIDPSQAIESAVASANPPSRRPAAASRAKWLLVGSVVAALLAIVYLVAGRPWLARPAASGSAAQLATAAPPAASIAVLPFSDLSEEGNQGYFSDGMAEEILNVLVHVDGLKVASRTSSFQFRKSDLGAPAIATKLGVRHVLEGSVRKAGSMVRVTAQLIDARSDQHLWSQTFDRPLTTANLFVIQDEIAKAIVAQLMSKIGGAGATVRPASPVALTADTANLEAYDLYLQGRALFIERNSTNLSKAASALKEALAKDPKFARAWEMLAAVYTVSEAYGLRDLADYPRAALDAAATATRLDPKRSLPFAVRGTVQMDLLVRDQSTSWEESIGNLTRAIENDPKEPTAYFWRAGAFEVLGYFERAQADLQRCLEIDPAYEICRRFTALSQLFQGHVNSAFPLYEAGLQKGFLNGDSFFVPALIARGDRIGALEILVRNYQNKPQLIGLLFRAASDPAFSDRDRQEGIAVVNTGLPTNDLTVEAFWLLKAYNQIAAIPLVEAPVIWWASGDAGWLRAAARKSMMRHWRLPEYWRKHGYPPQCKAVGTTDFDCR